MRKAPVQWAFFFRVVTFLIKDLEGFVTITRGVKTMSNELNNATAPDAVVASSAPTTKPDIKEMLHAGVHFGHKTSRWSPKMRPYIWGSSNKVHLIDVSKTAFLLGHAGAFLKSVAMQGGMFLWVGTKRPAQEIVKKTAEGLKMPYIINRWVGGTLSNYNQVKKAVTRLLYLRDVLAKPTGQYKKKEMVMIQKEVARLEKNVGGIIDLQYPPAAVIVVDAKREYSAIKEASLLGVPIIGIVDTNTDPEGINYVIPANDDSPKSIAFIMNYLETCSREGREYYLAKAKEERPAHREIAAAAEKVVNAEGNEDAPKAPVKKFRTPERGDAPKRFENKKS